MSVAFVIIALLSFSLTSLTAYTFRTAENTNRIVESTSNDARAKRLVDEAMTRMRREITNLVETEGIETFREFDTNYEDVTIWERIEGELDGISIELAEDRYDSEYIPIGVHPRAYRISYPLEEGGAKEVVRYLYFSDYGVQFEQFNAFNYSMGSNEAVALNGGNYLESTTIYADRIYRGFATAYKDSSGDYQVVDRGILNNPAGEDASFVSPRQYMCEKDTACLDTDADGKLVLDEENYTYLSENDYDNYYSNLFEEFDFDTMYFERLTSLLNADEEPITFFNYETRLNTIKDTDLLTSISDGNIQETTDWTLQNNILIEGDATLDLDGNSLQLNDHTMIVLGDLTINSLDAISKPGQIYVFGDVHVNNDQNLHMTSNLYTQGQINVYFDSGFGFISTEESQGMSLYAKGNILFERNTTASSNYAGYVPMFIFSESSIKFDSAAYPMAFGGAVYAQGKGDGLSDVVIKKEDGSFPNFKGILVNSFSGIIDPITGEVIPDGIAIDDYKGDYNPESPYEQGDIVKSDGVYYERTDKGNPGSQASFNSAHWNDLGGLEGLPSSGNEDNDHSFSFTDPGGDPVQEEPPTFDSNTYYSTGDVVVLDNTYYIAIRDDAWKKTPGQDGGWTRRWNTLNENPIGSSPQIDLEKEFYDLPDLTQLRIIPNENEIIADTTTFIYENTDEQTE